jgi:pyruvate, orthophosphate dikinase
VLAGRVPMTEPALSGEFGTLMGWADAVRTLGVRANADTPNDAVALKFGAEGIGLCRTEHMFFEEDRIRAVREMILADDEKSRRAALAKLAPMQRADFVELFEIMQGLPVTIRMRPSRSRNAICDLTVYPTSARSRGNGTKLKSTVTAGF